MSEYAASRNQMERKDADKSDTKIRHLEPEHVSGVSRSRCDDHLHRCRNNGTKSDCDEYNATCRDVVENVSAISSNVSDHQGAGVGVHGDQLGDQLVNSEEHHMTSMEPWNSTTSYSNHSEALSIEENFPQVLIMLTPRLRGSLFSPMK